MVNPARKTQIGTIYGIPVYLHNTFPYIFLIAAVSLSALTTSTAGLAMLLFGCCWGLCLIIHETTHIGIASVFAIPVQSITITPFYGYHTVPEDRLPRGHKESLWYMVGPLASFFIAVALYVAMQPPAPQSVRFFLEYLFFANLLYASVMMIPAFPMEGAYVIRGILENKKDPLTATFLTMKIGEFVSVTLAVYGLIYATLGFYALIQLGIIDYILFGFFFCLGIYLYFSGYQEIGRASKIFTRYTTAAAQNKSGPHSKISIHGDVHEPSFPGNPSSAKASDKAAHSMATFTLDSRVDDLLKKISENGYLSLTESEKNLLKIASRKYRKEDNDE